MDSRDLWEVFHELGCSLDGLSPNHVNWMSEDPSLKHFINWFLEHMSCDNVLEYNELEEFELLQQAGEELHGEALDEALIKAGIPIDLLPIDTFEINEEKDEISALKEQSNILSSVEERLLASLKKQEQLEILLRKDCNEAQKASFKDGQNLMKLSARAKSSLLKFHESLQQLSSVCMRHKDTGQHHFLSQAPFADLYAQCEIFKQNMKFFINRQFDQKEQHLTSDHFAEKEQSLTMFNSDRLRAEFKVHPQRLWEADVSRVCASAKLKGITASLENMQLTGKALVDQTTISNIRLYSARLQHECSGLASEIEILRQHEVSVAAQNFVVFKIAAFAEDIARQRCIRRRYRLEKLRCLQEKITRNVLLTDVLWMLLRRESKLVKLAGQFLDQAVTFLSQEYTKHVSVMELHNEIQQRYATYLKEVARGEIPLVASMCRLMDLEDTRNITALVDAFQRLLKQVEDVNQNGFMGARLDPDLSVEKSLRALQTLVAGPSKQISVIPTDIVQKIQMADSTLKQVECTLDEVERNFSAKQVYFSKLPVERDSRLLWVWFLADPPKLISAMKYAERSSQSLEKQSHGSGNIIDADVA